MNNKNNTENPMEMPKKKEELNDIKKVSTKQENKKIKIKENNKWTIKTYK